MVLALDESDCETAKSILAAHGESAAVIGRVVEGEGVTILNSSK